MPLTKKFSEMYDDALTALAAASQPSDGAVVVSVAPVPEGAVVVSAPPVADGADVVSAPAVPACARRSRWPRPTRR